MKTRNMHILPFTRRSFVSGSLGVATAWQLQRAARALGAAPDSPVCRLMAEQEVGPYYVPGELLRSNVAEGKPGVPLSLRVVLIDSRTCQPLENAAVDIWHCDALGLYSGFTKQSLTQGPGGPPGFDPRRDHDHNAPPDGPPPNGMRPEFGGGPAGRMGPPHENLPTDQFTFLRGIQLSNATGVVNFQSVFPGFYMGRTNHIHFKVRLAGHAEGKSYAAGHASHTGQIFFPEELAVRLMEHEPYSQHKIHRTTQSEDDIFGDQHGALSIASISAIHDKDFSQGLRAELIAAVDPLATPKEVGRRGGPPPE